MASARILVADDQPDVLEALRLLLKPAGFAVTTASSPQEVLSAVATSRFAAVLIDLNYTRDTTSGAEGLDLIAELHACDAALPIVVMTAWGSIALAVEAMRRGAADFVTKPWDNEPLLARLHECVDARLRTTGSANPSRSTQRDLWVARTVQQRLLPRAVPRLASLSCAARCEESGPVGGDFYDYFDLAPGRVGLAVADVSGKGVPAAIVMAHLSAALRTLAPLMSQDLTGVTRRLNALLIEASGSQHYVTLFLAVYSDDERRLRYVNCGHLPPLLRRARGEMEWLHATASVVGLLGDFAATCGETYLSAGDTLVVYTDGLTEAHDLAGSEFGTDRLLAALGRATDADPDGLVARLMDARRAFASGDERDDVTVLVAQAHTAASDARLSAHGDDTVPRREGGP